jgi:hypothetical protein
MLKHEFYNRSRDGKTVRRALSRGALGIWLTTALFLAGCDAPKIADLDRVCDEPIGTSVTIEGVIAVPRFVNTVYLTRGGALAENGYQVSVSDRSGRTANVTVWSTLSPQPNRIGALSEDVGENALRVYSNRGQLIEPGQTARITGKVVQDPARCTINAELIETAEAN